MAGSLGSEWEPAERQHLPACGADPHLHRGVAIGWSHRHSAYLPLHCPGNFWVALGGHDAGFPALRGHTKPRSCLPVPTSRERPPTRGKKGALSDSPYRTAEIHHLAPSSHLVCFTNLLLHLPRITDSALKITSRPVFHNPSAPCLCLGMVSSVCCLPRLLCLPPSMPWIARLQPGRRFGHNDGLQKPIQQLPTFCYLSYRFS